MFNTKYSNIGKTVVNCSWSIPAGNFIFAGRDRLQKS